MKIKVETSNGTGQPVWCDRCYIRIAPNEIRTIAAGKSYHSNCYSKVRTTAGKSK